MSDVALNGSIYQQLRSYADTLDRALIDLRDPRETKVDEARRQIADLLRKATVNQSVDHAALMLRIVLGRRLQGLALCDKLATVLEGVRRTRPSSINLNTSRWSLIRNAGQLSLGPEANDD